MIYAIILASGSGERTGLDIPKQFLKIGGKKVIEHTLDVFENSIFIDKIIIVSNINYLGEVNSIVMKNKYKKVEKVLAGGATRRESSFIGISSISENNAKVLIHDAVRPFLNEKIIEKCINALKKYKAVDVAVETADTIIKIDNNNLIENIPERKYLRCGQTPQAFDLKTIKKAHELANKDKNVNVTDDCGLVMKYNPVEIFTVEGDMFNRKITYPLDVAIADKLFQIKTSHIETTDKTKLKNKVLVIFGASRGIGKATAEIAKNFGAKVYGFSRSSGVDIIDLNSVKSALEEVNKKEEHIDYVVNTAGLLKRGQIICRSIEDIMNEIQINYVGAVNAAIASYTYLEKTKGSLLFYTSSSYTRGRAEYSVYSSTKAAIVNLAQALAEEWQDLGIKINCICPERTATPMRFENFGKEPEETLCPVEKVANASIDTLLSDFTGQIIEVKRNN